MHTLPIAALALRRHRHDWALSASGLLPAAQRGRRVRSRDSQQRWFLRGTERMCSAGAPCALALEKRKLLGSEPFPPELVVFPLSLRRRGGHEPLPSVNWFEATTRTLSGRAGHAHHWAGASRRNKAMHGVYAFFSMLLSEQHGATAKCQNQAGAPPCAQEAGTVSPGRNG